MDFLLIVISGLLLENFIFVKFLGCCPFFGLSDKPSNAIGMGCAVTFVMTVSTAATWFIYNIILVPLDLAYLKTIAFILIIASIVQIIEMFLKKYVKALYSALGIYLPLITTNCAILGCALLCVNNGYGFVKSVLYAFFSALGFTLAIVVFAGVRAKVEFADVPKCFKGIPIALVTAGLLAIAFSGFQGASIGA